MTPGGDITAWANYRGRAKIVYEQIDSYLSVSRVDPKALLRGLAKYVTGQNSRLRLSYWSAIRDMCRRADAVICTTDEQRAAILAYCDNVHVILDVHDQVIRAIKHDYVAGAVFNLAWEGLPENVSTFREIAPVLMALKRRWKLALHLVTDPDWKPHLKRFGHRHTIDVIRGMFEPAYVYSWNEQLSATIITTCDLAVIPIPPDVPLATGKPENKLLLFWRLGMPTLVSATPAYSRAMARAGLSMTCADAEEWSSQLATYIESEAARKHAGVTGREVANGPFYGTDSTLARWDAVIESALARS